MNVQTDYLFNRPTFLSGMASISDIYGNAIMAYNTSASAEEADALALSMDWSIVGQDIRRSVARMRQRIRRQRGAHVKAEK